MCIAESDMGGTELNCSRRGVLLLLLRPPYIINYIFGKLTSLFDPLPSPNPSISRITQYAAKEFGTCPLIQCNGQPVLPVGLRDEMGADTVKIYCPRCQSVYHPPPIRSRSSHHGPGTAAGSGAVDGAAFGTTFPHLFLMTFNNLVPDPLDSKSKYVPRVFGFRVHHSARQRIAPGSSAAGGSGGAAGLPSSTTVPQGNVGRSRHASGGPAAAAALARSGGRASAGGSAAAAAAAGAAGPSSPPAEVGLPAVSADSKQNGVAGTNGNGNFNKVTRGAAAAAAAGGGAGGSKSSGSGGARIKTSAAKGGSAGGTKGGGSAGGGKTKANAGGPPEKRKAASGAKANADGVKGGGAGDNNSTGSRAKRSKKAAAAGAS